MATLGPMSSVKEATLVKYRPNFKAQGFVLLRLEKLPEVIEGLRDLHIQPHHVPSDPDMPHLKHKPNTHVTIVGNIHVDGALAQGSVNWSRFVSDVMFSLEHADSDDLEVEVTDVEIFPTAATMSEGKEYNCIVLRCTPSKLLLEQRQRLMAWLPTYSVYPEWRPHVTLTYVLKEHHQRAQELARDIKSYLATHTLRLRGQSWDVSCKACA